MRYLISRRHIAATQLRIREQKDELDNKKAVIIAEKLAIIAERGIPNHVGSNRFSDADLEEIAKEALGDGRYTKRLPTEANFTVDAPREPPELVQEAIEDYAETLDESGDPVHELPWWAKYIIRDRSSWIGCGLSIDDAEAPEAYMFMYAKERPEEIMFMELRRSPVRMLLVDTEEPEDVYWPPASHAEFKYLAPLRFLHSSEMPINEDSELFVITGLRMEGALVCTDRTPEGFDEYVRRLPPPPPPSEKKTSKKPDKRALVQILEDYPWLDPDDFTSSRRSSKRRRTTGPGGPPRDDGGGSGESEPGSDSESSKNDEDLVDDGAEDEEPFDLPEELHAVREALELDDSDAVDYFNMRILGGVWTFEHAGEVADAAMGYARGGLATAWAAAYNYPKSKRFHFGRYGRENARMLAKEYIRKGNYFCRMWVDSDDDAEAFVYTRAMVAGYVPSYEFINWAADLAIDDPSFDMALEVRELAPDVDE